MIDQSRALKLLRWILFGLVLFDLAIALPALCFPGWVISLGHLSDPSTPGAPYRTGAIEPLFLRGVGVLWLLAAYVQLMAWRDPVERIWAVNIAIVFRFTGGTFELLEILWLLPRVGFDYSLAYGVLVFFVVGDYALVGTMVWLLHRAGLRWWRW